MSSKNYNCKSSLNIRKSNSLQNQNHGHESKMTNKIIKDINKRRKSFNNLKRKILDKKDYYRKDQYINNCNSTINNQNQKVESIRSLQISQMNMFDDF